MAAGFFCVVEGIDGSGKSGAVEFVVKALAAEGRPVVATREPGGTDAGLALRALLLASGTYEWTPTAELLLLNAARAQHVEKLIRPALAQGKIVICDRFVGSTIAYQGAGRGISEERIRTLHRLAADDFRPDLTIILDLDPQVAIARSRTRLQSSAVDEGRFEALDIGFHERVRRSFLDQAAASPKTHVIIDAARAPAEVQADVLRHVRAALQSQR